MRVSLLGSLQVEDERGPLVLGAAKERSLVCSLALRPGTVVSADALVAALWGERPPPSARKTLQTYVSNLRRTLGPDLIRTEPPGYVLVVDSDDVDAVRFRRLTRAGDEALRRDAPEEAAALFGEALQLWRGDPLGSVVPDSSLGVEAVRLGEEHLAALESRLAADLACGRHREVVGELEQLTRQHPFREQLWVDLALALYRCGRQGDALATCHRAATTLRDELGLEPGLDLRDMEQALLGQHPSLDWADTGREPVVTPDVARPPVERPPLRYARCSDGVHIAYEVIGDGPVDIIVVPGMTYHLDLWWDEPMNGLVRRLASFGRVILFDKRGMGLSDRPPEIEVEHWTDDVTAVLDAVGSERAVVIGLSAGGPTAILFAATHPHRTSRVVFVGGWACMHVGDDNWPGFETAELESWADHMAANWGTGVGISLNAPSRSDRHGRDRFGHYQRISASPGAAREYMRALIQLDVRHALPVVSTPTLILHSIGDKSVPISQARAMVDAMPDARLVELPSDDHVLYLCDAMDQIVDEIEAFVATEVPDPKVERVLATVLAVHPVPRDAALVREVDELVSLHGGSATKTAGLATFDGPRQAIGCAREVIDRLGRVGWAVGAGVHSGECSLVAGAVAGVGVDVVQAVAERAGSGDLLATQTVRDIIVGSSVEFSPRELLNLDAVPGMWEVLSVDQPDR